MHAPVIFIDLSRISFRSKSGQTFLENVNSERFVGSDQNIDSEVEFVSVYQQRVCHIATYHGEVVYVYVVYIVYQVDSFALGSVCWLHYPHIFLWVVLS